MQDRISTASGLQLYLKTLAQMFSCEFGEIFKKIFFMEHRRNARFEFLTSQTGQMAFPVFQVIMR